MSQVLPAAAGYPGGGYVLNKLGEQLELLKNNR